MRYAGCQVSKHFRSASCDRRPAQYWFNSLRSAGGSFRRTGGVDL